MEFSFKAVLLASVMALPSLAFAEKNLATIAEQDEILLQIESQLAEIKQENLSYWEKAPERADELRYIAAQAVDRFTDEHKRFPSANDKTFIQSIYEFANVKNAHESQLIFTHMDRYIVRLKADQ